jgi:deazaflavin-dependent oxidoreductase (nitroreductase family)
MMTEQPEPPKKKWVWKTPPWVPAHIEQYLNDPEAAHLWDASGVGVGDKLPTLLLITKGRVSGEPRYAPVLYREVDGAYVVIASKGGYPEHPAWFVNLMAAGEAEIQVASKHLRVRPRIAEGEERTRLWARMSENYSPFDDYQARAKTREIPVVVLEPVAEAGQ